jgi:hypothetical protein
MKREPTFTPQPQRVLTTPEEGGAEPPTQLFDML